MGLYRLLASSIALAASLARCASAQFTYPPPLERPLADYISGAAVSGLNFSAGDNMFGGWTTPGHLMSFLLYRCIHPTSSPEPVYPSNSSFTSRDGHLAPDGTWEQMPLYEDFYNGFGNGFNPGDNPIWFHGDFFAPNTTTGSLCWFELYPGSDMLSYENGPERIATVDGAGDWYFATVPFTVKPERPSGLTVTWKGDGTDRGKPTRDIFSNSSDSAAMAQEFSDGSSSGSSTHPNSSGSLRINVIGVFVGSFLALGIL